MGIFAFFLVNSGGDLQATPKEIYPFAKPEQSQQFQTLLSELRCLVCQNQDLKDSQASLAEDLRKEVYAQVQSGASTPEIKAYLTQRYGNFILFKPPFIPQTYILWIGPIILLVLGSGGFLYWVFRRQRLTT